MVVVMLSTQFDRAKESVVAAARLIDRRKCKHRHEQRQTDTNVAARRRDGSCCCCCCLLHSDTQTLIQRTDSPLGQSHVNVCQDIHIRDTQKWPTVNDGPAHTHFEQSDRDKQVSKCLEERSFSLSHYFFFASSINRG